MPRLLEKMEQNSAQPSLVSSPSTKETENSESGSKLTNSIAIGSSSQNSMAILEQTKSSDYENPLENNSYHVDSTGFAKESFRELDISDLESNEFSFSDCQMAKVDWTNDIAGAFWDIGESWEFLK